MHQFTSSTDLRPMPEAKLQQLLQDLQRLRPAGRAVAAFDADGTLWNTDLGEAFFNYQIQHRLVALPADPWGHYNWLKEHRSHTEAYVWLAQILKGIPVEKVREWAEASVAAQPLPVFPETAAIFATLVALDVEIYIVTASIKWAVEPGARRLGLTAEQVIGIETEVDAGGLITDRPHGVVTYREGKAAAILARTGGLKPFFCAGNTEGDRWLLEGASSVRLVLSAAPEGTENFPTEARMLKLAEQQGWHSHRY